MNIDEIDIYRRFLNGFKNDLKRVENTDCYYNCLNDLFKPLGMEFTDEKKTFDC